MDDPIELRLKQMQAALMAKRKPVVQRITRKNRLQLSIERIETQIQTMDVSEKAALAAKLAELRMELSEVVAEIATLKQELEEADLAYREECLRLCTAEFPIRNRERAKALLIAKELAVRKLVESPPNPPHRYQELTREMNLIMANISELRRANKDHEADGLGPRLNELIAEFEAEQPIWQAEMARRREEATAPFEQELDRLRET